MGSVLVKLRASVRLDAHTGQITTVLDDLPQVPLTPFSLRFRGGDHAILPTPRGCGTQTARAALTPWSGAADAQPTSDFSVSTDGSGGCAPIPFAPSVAAAP